MEHASLLLLKCPGAPLKQIANDNGYTCLSNFCRDFRLTYGITPSQFRRNNSHNNTFW